MTVLHSSAFQTERKRIAVLGCTGSIGQQTLDVCRQHADKLEVVALSAHSSTSSTTSTTTTVTLSPPPANLTLNASLLQILSM